MMAERRINRRSQTVQSKKRDNPPVIPEEDEYSHSHSMGTEKTVITKPRDATVEVTLKVKKRRDKSTDTTKKLIPLQEKEFRKGSWGDLLLSSSRTSINRKDSERDTKQKESGRKTGEVYSKKGGRSERRNNDEDHSPLCQKIPITDDLYLETHTHFRKTNSAERPDVDIALLKQNEDLRREILRLRKEVEVAKVRSGSRMHSIKETPVTSRILGSDRDRSMEAPRSKGFTQGTQTSTTSLISPRKASKASGDVVDGAIKTPNRLADTKNQAATETVPVDLVHLETMKMQNEELRQQIAKLMIDINQTRSENCEFVGTIKELHQTADALTRANRELQEKHNLLILNHHGQQALQEQLLQIVSHNVQMKEALEVLLSKQNSPTMNAIDDNQLAQFRNVIKDVKSTIAQEMQGLSGQPSRSAAVVENYVSNSALNLLGESFLNDTNASEIRRILASQPLETRRGGNAQEEGSSSTQYLNIDAFESHYRPSPLAVSKYSPRISTPNSFSNFSMSLSDPGASAFQQPTADPGNMNNWRALEDEVSRSFIPLRNELSNCSTSSYSSGSASSSPNPAMMRQ